MNYLMDFKKINILNNINLEQIKNNEEINKEINKYIKTIEKTDYFKPTENVIYKNNGLINYKNENEIGDLIIKFNILYPEENNNFIKYKKFLNNYLINLIILFN